MSGADRRAVALVIGGGLIGIVCALAGTSLAESQAVEQAYQQGRASVTQASWEAGYTAGVADTYDQLGIGQPGPPGVPGP